MKAIDPSLTFLIQMARVQATVSRRFDARLNVQGIGFTDFVILLTLAQVPGNKLRRIDLAEHIGVTASGATRTLAPLEKRGLVSRERNERDARVSYVVLTPAGQQLLKDTLKVAEQTAKDLLPSIKDKTRTDLGDVLRKIGS